LSEFDRIHSKLIRGCHELSKEKRGKTCIEAATGSSGRRKECGNRRRFLTR